MANTTHPAKSANQTAGPAPPALSVEREFNATPERLWEYWTDPKKYAKWLNPGKQDLKILKWDLREGGECRFIMPLDNGAEREDGGIFFVLDKPRHLVSGAPDKSFVLDVTFAPVDAKRTRVTVVSNGMPAEWHAMATDGWGRSLGKLEKLLAGA